MKSKLIDPIVNHKKIQKIQKTHTLNKTHKTHSGKFLKTHMEIQAMVDMLIDEPTWRSCFTNPPQSEPSSNNETDLVSETAPSTEEFCCYVDDIQMFNNNGLEFVIIDGQNEIKSYFNKNDLIEKLVKIGLRQQQQQQKQFRQKPKNPTEDKQVLRKKARFNSRHSFQFASQAKRIKKKRLGSGKLKLFSLAAYLESLNQKLPVNMSLSKYVKVVIFMVRSLFKRLDLLLHNSPAASELFFTITPLYGNTLFLSASVPTGFLGSKSRGEEEEEEEEARAPCAFQTKQFLQGYNKKRPGDCTSKKSAQFRSVTKLRSF